VPAKQTSYATNSRPFRLSSLDAAAKIEFMIIGPMAARHPLRLLAAIRHHDVGEIRKLLDEGLDPDTNLYLSGRLRPAISLAAEERAVEIGK